MRVKVSIGFVAVMAACALAGCGNRQVIGSTPPPSPTPIPPSVTAEFPITTAAAQPTGLTLGSDGNLYATLFGASDITQYAVATNTFTLFTTRIRPAGPSGITVGPDNNIWFTETTANAVGTISASVVKEFPLTAGAAPAFITPGPNSSLFFTEPGINAIGSLNTVTDVVSGPYAIPTANADPLGIMVGADNNVYFTEYNSAKIGRFNTTTNAIDTEIPLPSGSANPTDIRVGPDGALWFTENNPAGPKIARLSVATMAITEYPLTGAASATGLAIGADGNFYFADAKKNAIGSFNTNTQKTTEYAIPTANAKPTALICDCVPGGDDKMYFTEQGANKLGQLTYF